MAPNRFFSLRSLLTIGILVGGFFLLVNSAGVRAATYEAPKRAFPEGNPDLPTTSTLYEVLTQSAAAANGTADASNFSGDIVIGKADKATKLKLSAGNPAALTSVLELGSARNAWRFQMTANHGLYLRPLDHPSAEDPDFHITNQTGAPFVSFSPDVGRVGIGTTDPAAELEIIGKAGVGATALKVTSDGNEDDKVFHFIGNSILDPYQMVMMQTGNVGIGYTNPGTAKLAVNGNVGIGTTQPKATLDIISNSNATTIRATTSGGDENDPDLLMARNSGEADKFRFRVRGATGSAWLALWDDTNGTVDKGLNLKGNNIGLGTNSPDYALDIENSNEFPFSFQRTGTSAKRWALGSDNTGFELKNVTDNVLPLYVTNTGNVGIGHTNLADINAKLDVRGAGKFTPTEYQYVSIGTREFNGTPPASMYIACPPSGVSGSSFDAGTLRDMYCYGTRTAGAKYGFYELRPKTSNDGQLLAETVKATSRVDIGASNRDGGLTYGIDDAALEIVKPIFSRIGMVGLKPGAEQSKNVRFIVDARADKDIGGEDRAQIGTLSDHPLIFMTKDTVRMWLDNKGGLGIYGVNAADPAPLTLYHPTKSSVVSIATKGTDSLEDDVNMYVGSRNDGANSFGELNVTSNHDLKISTKGLERMVITNGGSVLVDKNMLVREDIETRKVTFGTGLDSSSEYISSVRSAGDLTNQYSLDFYTQNRLSMKIYKEGKVSIGSASTKPDEGKILRVEGGSQFIGGSEFSTGRHYFSDEEGKGRLRVGAAWDIPGIYSEDTQDLVLGVAPARKVLIGSFGNFMTVKGDGKIGIGGDIDEGTWSYATPSLPYKLTVQAGNVNIGGTGNGELKVRHVNGKTGDSVNYDHLYLQWGINKSVMVAGGGSSGKLLIGFSEADPLTNSAYNLGGTKLGVKGGDINVITASAGDRTALASQKLAFATDRVGFDVAELFETESEVEVGDVLVVGSKERKLKKSSKSYEQTIVGVVSGSPAILFEGSETKIGAKENRFTKGTKAPVALTGRVPVKVSLENGAIKLGDYLTTSSKPGIAMKSNGQGPSIGIALESYSGTGEAKILVFLKEGTSTTANLEQKVENLAKELEVLKKRLDKK